MASPPEAKNRLILLVDDSTTLRTSVRSILEQAGYELAEARDGVEGLEVLEELSRQGRSPAMIISDVNMPRLDGLSFIKESQKNGLTSFLPILVLTTESEPRAKAGGSDKRGPPAGW